RPPSGRSSRSWASTSAESASPASAGHVRRVRAVRIAIIGSGLIGASVGLAAKRRGDDVVVAYDADEGVAATSIEVGAADETAGSLGAALEGADLAVVAVPVAVLAETVTAALAASGDGCTVTDVGSTKAAVCRAAARSPRFVGGHPVCGSEARGPAHANGDL